MRLCKVHLRETKLLHFLKIASLLVSLVQGRPAKEDELRPFSIHFGSSNDYSNVNIPNETYENIVVLPFEFKSTNDGSGNYYFGVNIPRLSRYEIGEIKSSKDDNEIQSVRGQYTEEFSVGGDKNVIRTIGYTADENGYRPFVLSVDLVSSHLTTTNAPLEAPAYAAEVAKRISSTALGNVVGANTLG